MSEPERKSADESAARGRSPSLEIQVGSLRLKAERALSILAALAGVITAFAAASLAPTRIDLKPASLSSLEVVLADQKPLVEAQLALLKKDTGSVRSEVTKLTTLP